MLLNDALNHIIDDGIEAARRDYARPRDRLKLEGSLKGFEDCRDKTPTEIAALLEEAGERASQSLRDRDPPEQYFYWRCRALEIEWVANVLSNIMVAQGWPPITNMMTGRGLIKAAEIIGVNP
jgi:hypothetical protein